MAKIYEASPVVLVWLGVRYDDSDDAIKYLLELIESFDLGEKPRGYAY